MALFNLGYNVELPLTDPLEARELQRTMPSLFFSLPSPHFWSKDELIVRTPSRNYSAHDYKILFEDLDQIKGKEMYQMFLDSKDILKNVSAPGVPVHCNYGSNRETIKSLIYEGRYEFDEEPTVESENGDGTVSLKSLEICNNWKFQQTHPVDVKIFKDFDHLLLVKNQEYFDYLIDLLQTTDTLQQCTNLNRNKSICSDK